MYHLTSNKTSEKWQRITRVLSMFIEGMLKRAPNDTVLARFFKFTGATSQVHLPDTTAMHLGRKITSTGDYNAGDRRGYI